SSLLIRSKNPRRCQAENPLKLLSEFAGPALYCTMNTGDIAENTPRFQFQPLTDDHDEIKALATNIMGFRFELLLEAPELSKHPSLIGARYRPSRILISYPTSTNWVTLSWEDDKKHEEMTVQWLQRR
ncbi:hypothetical protein, partial [Bradyrhizobium japonicum]|uniref:hypothetical protein n=3 Tax=Bradyrhizobium TaxID=374 RepID=UPI001FD8C076